MNQFGQVKLTPLSPLLSYKAYDSFLSSIKSMSDAIYNGGNDRGQLEIALGNSIQAADSFLSAIGRDNSLTNTASIVSSVNNIRNNLKNVINDINNTGKFKPNDIQQAIGDVFIAAGDGLQYIKTQNDKLINNNKIPHQITSNLKNINNSVLIKNATILQHELNIIGFKIKEYGNERLGDSTLNTDDFTPEKVMGFFMDPKSYSGMLEEASRFIYSLVPDSANPWKGGEDYIGRGIQEWWKLLNNLYDDQELPSEQYYQCVDNWCKLNRSGQIRTYDPLALDLDGDGLETVGTRRFSGSLFDHNRDGIRTATGWVAADDGFLVYDRNGNGFIDDGGELFGDNTLLADGSRAAHGYAALAELDGNGDGKVDAADKDFSSLRVWRDLNQDGISQSGELFALAEVGVQAPNLTHTSPNTNLGNGNFLAQAGSYIRTDGSTAQMGDLDLAADHLFSRHSEAIELTDEQRQTPNLQGMGRLRDLREAAALSGSLSAVLAAYAAAETKAAQTALLDPLMAAWAQTDSRYGSYTPTLSLPTALLPDWGGDGRTGANPNEGWGDTRRNGAPALALTPSQIQAIREGKVVLSEQTLNDFNALKDKIRILDAFTGQDSRRLAYATEDQAKNIIQVARTTYESLASNLYQGLLFQTRLQPYLNAIGFTLENNEFKLDYSGVSALFEQVHAENAHKAFVDLGEFLAYGKANDWAVAGKALMERFIDEAKTAGTLAEWTDSLGKEAVNILSRTSGSERNDVIWGLSFTNRGHVSLNAGKGDDLLISGKGNESFTGGEGSDTYVFAKGFGQDTVYNYDVSAGRKDTIRFTDAVQNDFRFSRNNNDLVIAAKEGNDRVTVSNYFAQDGNGGYQVDEIVFADGGKLDVAAVKVLVQQGSDGNDNLYAYAGGSTLNGLDGNDNLTGSADVDILDGGGGNDTLYGRSGNDVLSGGSGNDNLYGEDGNDRLEGGDGNDYLQGASGNDTLIGGTGDDSLHGGSGNDTYMFAKGFGQDYIYNHDTSAGRKDTIQFTDAVQNDFRIVRNGNDLVIAAKESTDRVTVSNYFAKDGNGGYQVDEIIFADGKKLDVEAVKALVQQGSEGNDNLYAYAGGSTLNGGGGNDTLYGRSGNDVLSGGSGNDNLYGEDGNDRLEGGDGNDYLQGASGNDTLIGGTGDDSLHGGSGNDTYMFAKGFGQDYIYNHDTSAGRKDTIQFTDAVQNDFRIVRNGNDLVIAAKESTDRVTVSNYFAKDGNGGYQVDEIIFADGKKLDVEAVKALVQQGSEGNDNLHAYTGGSTLNGLGGDDTLYGSADADSLNGGGGNDTLYGRSGNDVLAGGAGNDVLSGEGGDDRLEGGEGNDWLYGDGGNDTLIGGAGNDSLSGGDGSDTYVFAKGFGQDTVNNYDVSAGRQDTIRFTDAMQDDFRLLRHGNNLFITAEEGNDRLTVINYFHQDGNGAYQIDEIIFADGRKLDVTAVKKLVQQGSEGSDNLYAYAGGSTLNGLGGNDNLTGSSDIDILDGGDGNDYLYGRDGDDVLIGGAGNDSLSGEGGHDRLEGGEGNDYLNGYHGNDTLIGGAGNDSLTGGNGSDTYVFAKGHGQDSVFDYATDSSKDTLLMEGIKLSETEFRKSGNDLVLSGYAQGDSVHLRHFFSGSHYQVENLVFADATLQHTDLLRVAGNANGLINAMAAFGAGNGTVAATPAETQQPALLVASALG
ncbi:MAG: calcium-binding protein [Eikenella sp.]|nr:calcium-binding protein [Eikenella sp.]